MEPVGWSYKLFFDWYVLATTYPGRSQVVAFVCNSNKKNYLPQPLTRSHPTVISQSLLVQIKIVLLNKKHNKLFIYFHSITPSLFLCFLSSCRAPTVPFLEGVLLWQSLKFATAFAYVACHSIVLIHLYHIWVNETMNLITHGRKGGIRKLIVDQQQLINW